MENIGKLAVRSEALGGEQALPKAEPGNRNIAQNHHSTSTRGDLTGFFAIVLLFESHCGEAKIIRFLRRIPPYLIGLAMVSYMRGFILFSYDFTQQGQQSVAFLFGQGAQLLFVPVIKQLTADPERLLALLRQLELIGASCFFLGDQPIVDQFGDTPLRIAPVHPQRLGQFGRSTARMLANIDDEEYQTIFYAKGCDRAPA